MNAMNHRSPLLQTPSQTIGPFFSFSLTPEQYGYPFSSLTGAQVAIGTGNKPLQIEGQIFDGAGDRIPNAFIEIWHADDKGRYAHPADPRQPNTNFIGYARAGTGTEPGAIFRFQTLKPGPVDPHQAPHISVCLSMPGLLNHLYTRIYFEDEIQANARDPVLLSVPEKRRETLLAQCVPSSQECVVYHFDIHLQGTQETVFFDITEAR